MAETEIEYARRRTAEELDRADRCSDSNAANVHRRLAVLYANMVAELRHLTPLEIIEQAAMPQPSTPRAAPPRPSTPRPSMPQPSTNMR